MPDGRAAGRATVSDRDEAQRRAHETMRRLQHEVRTPISQIIGYSELLEEELEDREQQDLAPDLHRIRDAAQRLLDLVDGRLREEEDPGAPPLPPAEPGAAAALPPAQDGATAPARILVIDGDASSRDLVVRRLERAGFGVAAARDGLDGLRRIESEQPDLVLLEILLPGMNGLEVLERVRRTRSRAELPVILATALQDGRDVAEGLERGANDYVTKPLDFPAVIARVRKELEAQRTARQVATLAQQLEFRSAFIRQALGRDVADDLLVEMSERPDAEALGAQRRPVATLVADVRGTRERARTLALAQHVAVLRGALGALARVAGQYGGLVTDATGDSLAVVFGLPVADADDAARAAACAVAMQLAMDDVNEAGARVQLPPVEIGVGVASGEVVLIGIGSGEQLRFEALGEPFVVARRLEEAAGPGEVWVCPETRRRAGDRLRGDRERELDGPTNGVPGRALRLLGVGGAQLVSLRRLPGGNAGAGPGS